LARVFVIDWAGEIETNGGVAMQNVARRFETADPDASVDMTRQRVTSLNIHAYDEVSTDEVLYLNVYVDETGQARGGLPRKLLERAVEARNRQPDSPGADRWIGCVEINVSTETARWLK
jgi:hypothetical protein